MKHLLLAIFCFSFSATISAQKVDTVLQEEWKNNAWQNAIRIITDYNADCQPGTVLIQDWNATSGQWENLVRTNYTYTGGTYVSQAVSQTWDKNSSSWKNVSRITYTYNASFQVTVTLTEFYSGGAWQNATRETNTYDGNGYLTTSLSELWFITQWQNLSRVNYTNNSDGTPQQVVYQTWNGINWDNTARDTYTYNGDKTVHQVVHEVWVSGAWQNDTRTTYTYDASKRTLTVLVEKWDGSKWVNDELTTNTYNGNNLVKTVDQSWDNASSSWENVSQTTFTYNGDGTLHQAVTQTWNNNTSAWENESRITFSYNADCALPLKLLSFGATRSNNTVSLTWQTADEVNTSHFTVQRSLDATNFTSIGNVTAKGTSAAINSYGFTDDVTSIKSGKIYYRLQMVDDDGRFTYSNTALVTILSNGNFVVVYPNPAHNTTTVSLGLPKEDNINVRLLNTKGETVAVIFNGRMSGGKHDLPVDLSTVPSGAYYVIVETKTGTQHFKLIKL